MKTPPTTLILDYGQVLCLPQPETDIRAMANLCGMFDLERFLSAYYAPRHEYDRGTLDGPTYWREVFHRLGTPLPETGFAPLIELDNQSWAHANHDMSAWVARMRERGVRTAMLSNMPFDMRNDFERYTPWLPAIAEKFFSCDFRLVKPEPGIYEICLEKMGISAGEALFVDDRPANVEGARNVGLQAIVFETTERFFEEVRMFGLGSEFER